MTPRLKCRGSSYSIKYPEPGSRLVTWNINVPSLAHVSAWQGSLSLSLKVFHHHLAHVSALFMTRIVIRMARMMRMVIITMIMVKTLSAVDHYHPTLPFTFMLTFTFSHLWIQPPGRWSCLSILPRDTSQLLQSLRRPSMNIVMHCLQCQVWTLFQREPLPWKTLIYLFFSVSLFYDRIEMMSNGQVSFHLLSNISNIQCDVTHIPLSLAPCHLYLKPPDSCNYF